jgi:hypothetical protein
MNSANDKTFSDYVIKSVAIKDIRAALENMKKQGRNRKLSEATVYAHDRISSRQQKARAILRKRQSIFTSSSTSCVTR